MCAATLTDAPDLGRILARSFCLCSWQHLAPATRWGTHLHTSTHTHTCTGCCRCAQFCDHNLLKCCQRSCGPVESANGASPASSCLSCRWADLILVHFLQLLLPLPLLLPLHLHSTAARSCHNQIMSNIRRTNMIQIDFADCIHLTVSLCLTLSLALILAQCVKIALQWYSDLTAETIHSIGLHLLICLYSVMD